MKVGIIGSGRVGEAIISGLINSGLYNVEELHASDIDQGRVDYISSTYGIKCYRGNVKVVKNSEVVIICVKPKDVQKVLKEVDGAFDANHILISVAAGVSTSYIASNLTKPIPIVRAMPNIAIMVREGMTVITAGPNANEKHLQIAEKIFGAMGKVLRLDEEYFDAVTALSGSGPAYMFLIIEALTDAGVKVGLPRDASSFLSIQTILGSAKMVLETKEHPAKLREMVTTPAGVTIEGIIELEEGKMRTTIINAVVKATLRSKELVSKNQLL